MKKRILYLLIFLLVIFLFIVIANIIAKYYLDYKPTIYEQNSSNNFPKTKIEIPNVSGYLIAIYKDKHKLKLYKNNKLIKEYDVNIRRDYEDRKVWEDSQTPEGIFKIETMDKVTNGWERWMGIDTSEKAKKIYRENVKNGQELIKEFENKYGIINSSKQIREFNKIYKNQKMLIGIGIHGGGFSLYNDWTNGCIAMSNTDVIELFDLLEKDDNNGVGTLVIIQD